MVKILVITDNEQQLIRFRELINTKNETLKNYEFNYAFSEKNSAFQKKYNNISWIKPISIKAEVDYLIQQYKIIISFHCKQIFPDKLVKNVRCINIHPGLNPYNRGWYPQVFSIINGLPCGATIHEIDEHLDHGNIICQKSVKIEKSDTSLTAYNKILETEVDLLSENIERILLKQYEKIVPEEGNMNLRKDFEELCKINLNDTNTFLKHINILRALTHGNYSNAYFIDEETGKKIYIKVEISHE